MFCGIWAVVSAPARLVAPVQIDDAEATHWVDSVFRTMNDDERIGQLFMVASFPRNDAATTNLLRHYIDSLKIGGVLFRQGDPLVQAEVTNNIQQMSRIPLFIALDGEWGLSMRLSATTRFPKNMMLGATHNEPLVEAYAREVGRQCREMGIHINFAPVIDVNNNPDNPVIGLRSFGENPDEVARMGIAYARGLESANVISVAKHFPGHGGTSDDSHFKMPTVNRSAASLDSIELQPFIRYIENGFSGVMTGHLYMPALDNVNRPASLSDVIVTDLLKKKMGFKGLCITDALEMKGAENGSADPSVQALIAGNDIVLSPANADRAFVAVKAAIKNGLLKREDLDERCRKVLRYKYMVGLNNYKPVEIKGLHERLNTPYAEYLTAQLNADAITVLKNEQDFIPLKSLEKRKIAVLTIGETSNNAFLATLGRYMPVTDFRITAKTPRTDAESLIKALESYDTVICGVFTSGISEFSQLNSLAQKTNLVYVFFTQPYLVKSYRSAMSAKALIVGHEATPYSQSFAAQVIFGGIAAKGNLSVAIPQSFPVGAGIATEKTRLGYHLPEAVGMNAAMLDSIDVIVNEGLEKEAYPGCQVLVAKDGMIVYNKSFGQYEYGRSKQPVTEMSVYDLASVSKATGTLLAVMKACDDSLIALNKTLADYLPELRQSDKADITVSELLYHQSGFLPTLTNLYKTYIDTSSYTGDIYSRTKKSTHPLQIDGNVYARTDFKFRPEIVSTVRSNDYPTEVARRFFVHRSFGDTLMAEIKRSELKNRGRYVYSDVNFVLLKMIVERLRRQPMDTLLRAQFFDRLGAYYMTYRPLDKLDSALIVPTENDRFMRRQLLRGYVHDETAALQGGVSGNAGLFANANDMAKMLQLYLNDGVYGGERYLSEATCQLFTQSKSPVSRRGLGFDKPETDKSKASPCGELTSPSVYGHTGYTGTCFWVDPDNQLIYIFLSNRVNPSRLNNKLTSENIRTRIQDAIYRSLQNDSK